MDYKFIKVQMKAAPDGKQPTGFWLFEPQSERQILEHWEKYARATIGEGARILTKKKPSGIKVIYEVTQEQMDKITKQVIDKSSKITKV